MLVIVITVAILVVLLFSSMPIAMAMLSAGIVGLLLYGGTDTLLISAKVLGDSLNNFLLLALPLFIVLGVIMSAGKLGEKLYKMCDVWLRKLPGGVGCAALVSCAMMAAMCGTTSTIAATIGASALPSLQRFGYRLRDSEGLIAGGGTLGTMIPPSASMIIIGALYGENVAKLFLAGVIPGIIITILFIIYNTFNFMRSHTKTELAEFTKPISWKERWQATKDGLLVLLLPASILVPLYTGIASPTEVAAIGAVAGFILVFGVYRTIGVRDILPIFRESLTISAMIGFIICGGMVFGAAITNQGLPFMLRDYFIGAGLSANFYIGMVIVVTLIMGMFVTGAPMAMILLPILLPGFRYYQIDIIWFSVIWVLLGEIGALSPPVGINVYVTHGVAKNLGYPSILGQCFRGSMPYMIILISCVGLILAVPTLATWLPSLIKMR